MLTQGTRHKHMSRKAFRKSFDRAMRLLSPLPPPHHRWIAATAMVKAGVGELDTTDPVVAQAAEYLLAVAACTTGGEQAADERAAVRERWLALSAAEDIFKVDDSRKWQLEAWLLTGLSDCEIADRCGLLPTVVGIYENLFFGRREYLDQPEWLAGKLFGRPLALTFRNEELGRFWAWAALTGGPAVLSSFSTAFDVAKKADTLPTLAVYLEPGLEISSSLQATVAVHVIPTNRDTAIAWAAFRVRLMEAEAMPDPRQREVAFLRLKQDFVRYAAGVLDGKRPEKLQHLLRLRRRKTGASVELSPEAALADLIAKLKIDLPLVT